MLSLLHVAGGSIVQENRSRTMMKKMMIGAWLAVLISCAAHAEFVWDVLNVEYGNGVGQVAATGGWTYAMNWYYSSSKTPTEVLSDGKTTLSPSVEGGNYGGYNYTNPIFTMPTNDTWSIEFSAATPSREMMYIYLGDGNRTLNPEWLVGINCFNRTQQTNYITNYNTDLTVDIAPDGYDSAQMNSYIFAHDSTGLKLYVNGVLAGDIGGGTGGGAVDGFPFMFALAQTVEVSSVRISDSTFVPEPASLSLVLAGVIGLVVKRKRK
jgi:hypothetical protein